MKRKVTLKQIARELDVSISTVSKALRNSKEISEDTIQKVQAFAKLYNYRPNNIALSLKNRKTKTIGVIIPEIVHHFFSKVIRGVELYANNKGYNVIVGLSNESFDKEVINMEMLANGSIDGFILSISKETQKLECFSEKQRIYNAFQKDCRTWYKTNAKTKTASEMRLKNAKNKNKHAKQKYKKNAKTKTASELRLKNAKTKTESEIATEKCEKQKQTTQNKKVQEKCENKNSK